LELRRRLAGLDVTPPALEPVEAEPIASSTTVLRT
jgi:hypothetical protein